MKIYSVVRIIFAFFLMVLAFPYILQIETTLQAIFWTVWALFFFSIIGGNLAILLHVTPVPVMEQQMSENMEQRPYKRARQR
ncbi:hypothetical protein [Pseudogracilibacillus sp. ICA-222130]|uniref:hypothetical protein n=1 Tax=Pseudogracilibacillus sp. ICA-222130 TaxID=3134655 RepID=UPI0030BAE73A